jgi:hypothetical protein
MMADVNKQLELMQAEKQHLLEEKNSLRSEVQEMKEKNSQQQSIIAILQVDNVSSTLSAFDVRFDCYRIKLSN